MYPSPAFVIVILVTDPVLITAVPVAVFIPELGPEKVTVGEVVYPDPALDIVTLETDVPERFAIAVAVIAFGFPIDTVGVVAYPTPPSLMTIEVTVPPEETIQVAVAPTLPS